MPRKKNAVRKDGRIPVQIYLGLGEDGRRKYKTVYGKTQQEADARAEQIKLQLGKGIDILGGETAFKVIAEAWLFTKSDVSYKYYENLKSQTDFIISIIGKIPVSTLTAINFQSIINGLTKSGRTTDGKRSGKPAAQRTLAVYKNICVNIMDMAIENRLLDYNPAQYIRIPSNAPKNNRVALTEDQQKWIVDTVHDARLPAMIMMYAGLRRGELLPLQWRDIDFKNGTISVTKSVEIKHNQPVKKEGAKTLAGVRTVYIPHRLITFLKNEYIKSGENPMILVCPGKNGKIMTETAFRRMWESYIKDLNFKYGNRMDKTGKAATSKFNPNGIEITIPRFTPHCLRHTFATLMYHAGVDALTAKEQMGHSDIKTTLSIYTHLDNKYKKRNMGLLDEFLGDASMMQVSKNKNNE